MRTVSVTIRFTDFRTITRSKTLAEPSDLDGAITATAKYLFAHNWDGRAKLRLVGVSLESLTGATTQLALLGAEQKEKLERLARAADKLRDRFGFNKIQLGGSLNSPNKS